MSLDMQIVGLPMFWASNVLVVAKVKEQLKKCRKRMSDSLLKCFEKNNS